MDEISWHGKLIDEVGKIIQKEANSSTKHDTDVTVCEPPIEANPERANYILSLLRREKIE